MRKIILFDLDWTLIYTGGAGIRALNRSFEKNFKISDAMKTVSPDGKTDPAIVREMIRVHLKRDPLSGEIDSVCQGYIEALREEVNGPGYRVMPGIPEILNALQGRTDVVMGLGTGNLEEGAKIKLARADLMRFFPFGGYSTDSEDRPTVLATASKRGQALLGHSVSPRDVIVIGDNKRDVQAGQAIGAVTVAVATGPMTLSELKEYKPDFAFENLSDTQAILTKLL